ncbi:MAG: 6-bladed beta-propeller, partial [Longimicrobiales bacterium]
PVRAVIADRRSRYWVVAEGNVPLVFDQRGKFLSAIGREGQGPGEFRGPTEAVLLPGDSVLIIDNVMHRASIIGPDLKHARSIRLPAGQVWRVALFDWPRLVMINAMVQTPAGVGWPLHLANMSGDELVLTKSFGENEGTLRPGRAAELRQQLSQPDSGRIWAADMLRYSISRWDRNGTLQSTLRLEPTWFPGTSNLYAGNRDRPPDPRIHATAVGSTGHLWVYTLVARPTWRDAWKDKPRPLPGVRESPSSASPTGLDLLHTRVEAIDIRARRVLTATVSNDLVIAALAGDRVASVTETFNGILVVLIKKVALKER